MGSFKNVFISFVLVAVITLSLITFSVNVATNNDADATILENQQINSTFSGLEEDLRDLETTSQDQRENFEDDSITSGLGFLVFQTIISGGRVFTGIIIGFFNILGTPLASIIGVPTAILGAFTSILVVSLILLAWRLYKRGD